MDLARAVAVLPVGAIEAHGPHLPTGTDNLIALAMAEECARRLGARGLEALVLPPVIYTAAPFASGFAGTLSVRPETTTALIVDVGNALAANGVQTLAVANAQGFKESLHMRDVAFAHAQLSEVFVGSWAGSPRRPLTAWTMH